jgi:hypothetical protein
MRRSVFTALLAALMLSAASANPAAPKPDGPEKVTVDQLEQALSVAHGKADVEMAQALSSLELTERLSAARLAHLKADLPGEKSQQALAILADQSAFLPPPEDEIVADPTPDAAATRQMLVQIVNYVNTTVRQLPNLMAIRDTSGFEDRPQEDRVDRTGTLSLSYLPLHLVGQSSVAVTYRDRKEVVDESATKALKKGNPVGGLVTSGEFGPILTTVLADALKGTITWARWEQRENAKTAVFHYAVPDQKSNYYVKFCCIMNGFRSDQTPDLQLFNERAGYHGEIAFDPADGSIQRVTLEAEMPPTCMVPHAGIVIEYSSVEIGGKNYTCPARSVSLLQAHTAVPQGAFSRANYQGTPKTYLNEVEFAQYRRFGSETRILSGDNDPPAK